MRLTCNDLVLRIKSLPKNRYFNYISGRNRVKVLRITEPEGPVYIERIDKNGNPKEESLPTAMIWRVANAIKEGVPMNIDRVLGASYNTRTALETLLVYSCEFYTCKPMTVQTKEGTAPIFKKRHKHLIWMPNKPHKNGVMGHTETDIVVSEVPLQDAYYEAVKIPDSLLPLGEGIDINIKRRHAQIQVALALIGKQLKYRTWIAQNDRGILYNERPISDIEGVVPSLKSEGLMQIPRAADAAKLIDCLWFKNGTLMPAIMEIEHSTGVTSGLDRMKTFHGIFPSLRTRYAVVAPDELEEKVIHEANKEHYRALDTRFFPYSAVEELYTLCTNRKIEGVTEEFLDCYMKPVVTNRISA